MRRIRTITALIAIALLATACGSSGGDDTVTGALAVTPDDGAPDEVGDAAVDAAGDADPVDLADPNGTALILAEADAAIEAVRADCVERGDQVSDLQGEPLDDTIFEGPSLVCARLAGVNLAGAFVGTAASDEFDADGAGRLDLSGADLSGADLRDARLSVDAVGTSFVGADLRGADLTDSDLRGADFTGANLVGSTMTAAPNGLARATFLDATMGCNVLIAGPGVILTGVTVQDECVLTDEGGDEADFGRDDSRPWGPAFWTQMTLRGNLDESRMEQFDFSDVIVEARTFRGADLTQALLTDDEDGGLGVWPSGTDFTGATLVGADLSGTGFHDAVFDGADLSGAFLVETYFRGVSADGANLTGADLFEFWAQRTSLRAAVLTGADLSGGLLDRVDLSDADLTDTVRERLELTEVVCPSGVATVGNVGSCDVGDNFDLSAGSADG
ncbi:MAG: pentapeptide repeat-containing protein [Actinomycetota bacterium]